MSYIQIKNANMSVGSKRILVHAELLIQRNSRIGIVGSNGAGKSTLLKLLAGELQLDDGSIQKQRNLIVSRVDQFFPMSFINKSVFDYVKSTVGTDFSEDEYRLDALLEKFGLDPEIKDRRICNLNGGTQSRLQMIAAILSQPDLILLDEPTNHLDLPAIYHLQDVLNDEIRSALCIVSHDRELLNSCTSQTVFVRSGKLIHYLLRYAEARNSLEIDDNTREHKLLHENREIKRLESSAKRLAIWGRDFQNEKFSRRAKSMEKQISKMKDSLTEVYREREKSLQIDPAKVRSKYVLRVEEQPISVEGRRLFDTSQFFIKKGDKVAILGANGSGKSTLFNTLYRAYKDDQRDESINFNPQTNLGYYDQHLNILPSDVTLRDYIADQFPELCHTDRVSQLVSAGFDNGSHSKLLSKFSGGERARIHLFCLRHQRPNFIIFDEPTNHLDLDGCERLEEELANPELTVVFSSHDRSFLKNVATRFLLIEGGRLRELAEITLERD